MLDLDSETTFFGVFDGHGGNHNMCFLCSVELDCLRGIPLCQVFIEPNFNITQPHTIALLKKSSCQILYRIPA
jgi:serine/threonine protein phosphatase PrpC